MIPTFGPLWALDGFCNGPLFRVRNELSYPIRLRSRGEIPTKKDYSVLEKTAKAAKNKIHEIMNARFCYRVINFLWCKI